MSYTIKFMVNFIIFLLLFCLRNSRAYAASKHNYTFKIYNGTDVSDDNILLKYMATVWFFGKKCGGVIIAPNAVLTAGFCVEWESKILVTKNALANAQVCAGSPLTDCGSPTVQFRGVKEVLLHDEFNVRSYYNRSDRENDLAIFVLDTPLVEDAVTVERIKLPLFSPPPGIACDFIAWGDIWCVSGNREDFTYKSAAQHTTLVTVSREDCQDQLEENIYPSNMCAVDPSKCTKLCKGDHGSGLFCNGDLVGILSLTKYTAGVPSIFTDVFYCRSWIKEVLKNITSEPQETHNTPQNRTISVASRFHNVQLNRILHTFILYRSLLNMY